MFDIPNTFPRFPKDGMRSVQRKKLNVNGYCGFQPQRNHWLPLAPGHHGYGWIGPTYRETKGAHRTKRWELFVCISENQWEYRGTYRFIVRNPLSFAEWTALPDEASTLS